MANEKILVVDDDTNICELLRLYLTKEGYQVTVANDGEEGLEKFNQVKPDMVLLDVMMPKMDGLEVCRRIRKLGNTPVMMLTAKGETFDKVLGLELGADDYMVKPFDAKEVVARIKAVLRRCQTTSAAAESTEGVIEFDNLRLDMNSYELRVKGKVVEAPPKELELLACLAGHPNRVYTRDQLLDEVWGFEYYGDSRTIDVHVKRLRERLETFIECSLDFGCIGIEVFVDDVVHITCNGNLSLAYDTDKFSHTLMNVLADANMSAISCGKTCICHELTDILLSTLFLHSVDWLKFTHIIILICCIFIKTLLLVGNS